jgi:hypothetical protein
MKKTMFSLVIMLSSIIGFSQLVSIPAVHMVKGAHIVPGTKCITSVVNTTGHTVTMYPLAQNRPDPYCYISRNHYLQSQMPVFTGDSLAFKKQLLHNFTAEYKSTNFRNHERIFDQWKSAHLWDFAYLEALKSDMLGNIVSMPSQQCFEYASHIGANLVSSRVFGLDDIRIIGFDNHSIMEAQLIPSAWASNDGDPGMPGCNVANTANPIGYRSVSELVQNPNLITDGDQYLYPVNGIDSNLCPWMSMAQYRTYYTQGYSVNTLYKHMGMIRLILR